MKAHEVFQKVYEKKNPKELAGLTGLSVSTLHKWAETGESHRTNPLELVSIVTHATGDLILVDWSCHDADGFFVKNVVVKASPVKVAAGEEALRMMREIGLLEEGLAEALQEPGSAVQVKKLRGVWEVLKSDLERLVRSLENRGLQQWLMACITKWYLIYDALTPGGVI